MSAKRWLTAAALAISANLSGCVSCDHAAHKSALDAGPQCDLPTCERQKVYVYMLNGLTPTGTCGLEGLRDQLAAHGFPKIGCGQVYHAGWVADEMKRVLAEDPDARFVLLGYDLGGAAAVKLAADSLKAGLPVDAVVLLDPMGKGGMTQTGVRTLLVTSGAGRSPVPHTESVSIPDVGHYRLPTHPQTVAVVCHLLNEIAAQQMHPEIETFPMWSYEHAPPPRVTPIPGAVEWNLLSDRPGGATTPLGASVHLQRPAKIATSTQILAGISKP